MEKKFQVPRSAITERGLKKLIKDAVKSGKYSSNADWANHHDITPQQVSAFFNKVQGPGLKIPQVLGYRPQVVYLPVDEDPISNMNPPRRIAQKPTSKVDHTRAPIEKRGLLKKDDREETKKRLRARKKS